MLAVHLTATRTDPDSRIVYSRRFCCASIPDGQISCGRDDPTSEDTASAASHRGIEQTNGATLRLWSISPLPPRHRHRPNAPATRNTYKAFNNNSVTQRQIEKTRFRHRSTHKPGTSVPSPQASSSRTLPPPSLAARMPSSRPLPGMNALGHLLPLDACFRFPLLGRQ